MGSRTFRNHSVPKLSMLLDARRKICACGQGTSTHTTRNQEFKFALEREVTHANISREHSYSTCSKMIQVTLQN